MAPQNPMWGVGTFQKRPKAGRHFFQSLPTAWTEIYPWGCLKNQKNALVPPPCIRSSRVNPALCIEDFLFRSLAGLCGDAKDCATYLFFMTFARGDFLGWDFQCLPTAPPPWPKSAPPRGGTFDLKSLAIRRKCPPTKKSHGKPCTILILNDSVES